jgi:hypothetical protein
MSALSSRILTNIFGLTAVSVALTGAAFYNLREHHVYNLEEHQARMDELEGTLRAHIGVIEESLDRIEKTVNCKPEGTIFASEKSQEYYSKRGRDDKESKV